MVNPSILHSILIAIGQWDQATFGQPMLESFARLDYCPHLIGNPAAATWSVLGSNLDRFGSSTTKLLIDCLDGVSSVHVQCPTFFYTSPILFIRLASTFFNKTILNQILWDQIILLQCFQFLAIYSIQTNPNYIIFIQMYLIKQIIRLTVNYVA